MQPYVQLIGKESDCPDALYRSLSNGGHEIRRGDFPAPAEHGVASPVIYIIDLDYLPNRQWNSFVEMCREQNSICLAYSSEGHSDRSLLEPLQPAAAFLEHPLDPEQVQDRINVLLAIRELAVERDEARVLAARRQRELQEALQSAAQIQRRLIPTEPPDCEHLRFAWRFRPCKRVGGDLFNISRLDEETIMVYLMDVSGHGISSAMVSVAVHQSLAVNTGQLPKRLTDTPPYYVITPPARIMERLEEEYPFERFEEFFSLVYLLLSPGQGRLRYCCAGHPPPLLLRSDGRFEPLDRGGTIIGMGGLVAFEEGEVEVGPEDRLFLYTDGITEYGPPGGEPFGEERLRASLNGDRGLSLDAAIEQLMQALSAFGGDHPQQDDVTLLGIEFQSGLSEQRNA